MGISEFWSSLFGIIQQNVSEAKPLLMRLYTTVKQIILKMLNVKIIKKNYTKIENFSKLYNS